MRNLLVILIAVVLAAPLCADEAQFFIERIEVRNAKRVSPVVVIAESRLREGHAYSENALRDAATRLSRLPFLLSVDFALEKGSERGHHVLVLTIQETKPFFYLLDLRQIFNDHYVEVFRGDTFGRNETALGYRRFVGRRGAVHVGMVGFGAEDEVRDDYVSLAIGYTQYDLFGSRAFATVNLKRPIEGYGEGLISPQVVAGVPLSANQTLTLEFNEMRFERKARYGQETARTKGGDRFVEARWSYNTTNDPFLPTDGLLLRVAPFYRWHDGSSLLIVYPDQVTVHPYHVRSHGLQAGVSRYQEITDRDSVFGDLQGWWAREDIDTGDVRSDYERVRRGGSIGAGISHSFWNRDERANGGDSRVELSVRYSNRRQELDLPLAAEYESDVRQVSAAWVRRSSWGTLRLGAGYAR